MDRNNADVMKKMQYILNMRPVLNTEALFSDGLIITVVRQIPKQETRSVSAPHQAEQRRYGLFSIRWQASTDGVWPNQWI